MKRSLLLSTILLALVITVCAQDKTQVSVKIVENGKVVKDTSYTYNSLEEAEDAIEIMDLISNKEHIHVKQEKHEIVKKKAKHKKCRDKKDIRIEKKIIIITDEDESDEEVIIIKKGESCDEDVKVEVIINEEKMVKDDKYDIKKPAKKKIKQK